MKNVFKIAIRLLFLLLFYSVVNAQSLVSTIALNDANLNAAESQRYSNLQQDAFTKELKLVNFGNPRDFVNAQGVLQFEFPDIQGVIEAQAIDIAQTDTSYSWTGRLLNHAGYFGFYEISGHRAAWLQIGQRFFEIMPMKSSISTVREIEGDVLDSGNCILSTENQIASELNLCQNDYNTCAATIDILVLLPPDAIAWLQTRFGNDWLSKALYVGLGTQALNAAFVNSDIPNKKANIILEQFQMQYPSGTSCLTLLNAIQAQATSRRDAVGADIVVLLTANADYNCGSGAACAEISNSPPYACDPGFTFSEIWWLFHPRWSMLHEVGHLMGGGHDRPWDNDYNCAHGWTVGDNRFQRTLMALWFGTQNPTDMRILHYSNPDVEYNGEPTGTEDDNNAKVIRNGACVVAGYRQSTYFDAYISTDPWVCRSGGNIYLDAVVQQPSPFNPGIPPYTYEWKWNFSGNFSGGSGTPIGLTQSVSFPIPITEDHVWVQLKVYSLDGVVLTDLKPIAIFEDDDIHCNGSRGQDVSKVSGSSSQVLLLVPNPANSAVDVRWSSKIESDVVINIIDALGRASTSYSSRQVDGENIFHLDLSALPTGIYGISLQSGNGAMFQKLVVNR